MLRHPNNPPPRTKLESGVVKVSNFHKTKALVKFNAGLVGVYQNTVDVTVALLFQNPGKFFVKARGNSLTPWCIGSKNNRPFNIPLVGIVGSKRRTACIAKNFSIISLGKKEGIFL